MAIFLLIWWKKFKRKIIRLVVWRRFFSCLFSYFLKFESSIRFIWNGQKDENFCSNYCRIISSRKRIQVFKYITLYLSGLITLHLLHLLLYTFLPGETSSGLNHNLLQFFKSNPYLVIKTYISSNIIILGKPKYVGH